MSLSAIITMIAILVIVWGGLGVAILKLIKEESALQDKVGFDGNKK